jgi:hypothetical protein
VDAIHATATDTEEDIREMREDEAMTRWALDLLGSRRNDTYEAGLAALCEDTQSWWADTFWRAISDARTCSKKRDVRNLR